MIEIVRMTPALCPGVHAVENACLADPWSLEAFVQELDNPHSTTLAAVEEGVVVGFVNVHLICGECSLNNIAVSAPYRRRGTASLLLKALIAEMRDRAEFITLEVRVSNDPAIALYQKFGFEPVGRRRNFYAHPTEDALLMTLTFAKESSHETVSH